MTGPKRSRTATVCSSGIWPILGNSGAGKSWAVALLLERAARRRNASLIVLDRHGEYGPLAEGGIVTRLRLDGPADFDVVADDLIFIFRSGSSRSMS